MIFQNDYRRWVTVHIDSFRYITFICLGDVGSERLTNASTWSSYAYMLRGQPLDSSILATLRLVRLLLSSRPSLLVSLLSCFCRSYDAVLVSSANAQSRPSKFTGTSSSRLVSRKGGTWRLFGLLQSFPTSEIGRRT